MTIRAIPFEAIARYKNADKNLAFCKNTDYFGLYDSGVFVGFAGLLLYPNKAVDKNIYVLPDYRGNGYFKAWLDWRAEYLKRNGINKIEATCTAMSLREYLKRGAVVVKRYRLYTKVSHENI